MGKSWTFPALLAISLITAASAFYFGQAAHTGGAKEAGPAVLKNGCVYWTEYCYVPFTRLINFPERYQGRKVETIGYLVWSSPVSPPSLYPNEQEVLLRKGWYERIDLIDRLPWMSDELKSKSESGVWVSVVGVFNAAKYGNGGLGALNDIHEIEDVTRNLGSRPPPPEVHLKPPVSPLAEPPRVDTAPDSH